MATRKVERALFAWATASSQGTHQHETLLRIPETHEVDRLRRLLSDAPELRRYVAQTLMSCNCEGWRMQKKDQFGEKKPRDCKHITGKKDGSTEGYVGQALTYVRMLLNGERVPDFRTAPVASQVESTPSIAPMVGQRLRRAVNFD